MSPTYNGPAHAFGRAGAEDLVAGEQRGSPITSPASLLAWRKRGARRPSRTELRAAIDFCAPRSGFRALGDVACDVIARLPLGNER
jgi:hypothetical protein